MTLLTRLLIGFAAVVLVFAAVSTVNLVALDGLRAADGRVSDHLAVIDALRETELRLAGQESVLDAYIASADEALKAEFLGPAWRAVDESMERAAALPGAAAAAPGVLPRLVAAWRTAAEVDMLVFQRQAPTQAARASVRDELARMAATERQAIAAAQDAKEVTARLVGRVAWAGMLAAVVVGAAAAGWLLRTVQRPLLQLTTIIEALTRGEAAGAVPATARRDEIGTIARAVAAFRQTLEETARLRTDRERLERRAQAEREAMMERMADAFEASVREVVERVAAASTELQSTARSMTEIAETTNRQALSAEAASGQASASSQVVATSAEALRLSIRDIRAQIAGTVAVAGEAVAGIAETNRQMAALSDATERIGGVVRLIGAITKQTNTLALNATIEAARAGDAGRGFAVVATEVRALAAQIAQATAEIAAKIDDMQGATARSAGGIEQIAATVRRMSAVADAVAAAVDEQGAATDRISQSVQHAAVGSQSVTSSVAEVTRAADETRTAAGQVLAASGDLSRHAEFLLGEVDAFVSRVRAAAAAA